MFEKFPIITPFSLVQEFSGKPIYTTGKSSGKTSFTVILEKYALKLVSSEIVLFSVSLTSLIFQQSNLYPESGVATISVSPIVNLFLLKINSTTL